MGDTPIGDVTHAERQVLDALRRRAYGPDADIFDDPAALSRLRELEDRIRLERLPVEPGRALFVGSAAAPPDSPAAEPDGIRPAVVIESAPAPTHTSRWHPRLLAGTAAAAVMIGAVTVNGIHSEPADEAGIVKTVAVADQQRDYQRYIDGLRDDVLSLPGSAAFADRIIRDQLRPYGTLYGRIVGSGPTTDHEFCMIISDLPTSSITCISIENAYANPVSVTLPSWYADSRSDDFLTGHGRLVSYTLMPGGSVVAVPTDSSDSART
ncbi:hypothetical protein [Microbacterium deminutum]|uniref:Uncharacterized protein n=1 Tax=Microbacterium deminutum TaxID=344164 RepID=A0ABN2QIH8_9MICO